MSRFSLLLFPLAIACLSAKPTDYSTDMVMLERGQVTHTSKLYVAGLKARVEGLIAGPLGRIITIVRRDKGVTWMLYPDKRQYTEQALVESQRRRLDFGDFDVANAEKEILGRETVLGYACTKMRVNAGTLPNGQRLTSLVWVADSLDLPVRMEAMGMVQENRNIRVGPQHAGLFEIPDGFTRTNGPGMPAGMQRPNATGTMPRYGGKNAQVATQTTSSTNPAWTLNSNYPGGDYRTIDMATADPTACKAACDNDAPCKAWTLVKQTEPGGMGYCWLKDSVPPLTSEDCCISGLKGAGGRSSASKYKLEPDINRYGDDYHEFVPATANPDLCAEACEKGARCKSWTWVKAELEGPTGHCWLKSGIPEATKDTCCVSGLK
jgi:hypothetical protein